MGLSWTQTWTLCVLLSAICASQAAPGPRYMVAIPAVLEARAETKFCASLMQPNETLTMTVTLISTEANTTLLTHTSDKDFHICTQFQVPSQNEDVQKFKVEVEGKTFYSKKIRKVLIQSYQPATFIQTDKPIYLPGQTVHFRVVTLDSKLIPTDQRYNIIELTDPQNNRIGQWLNETSKSVILQRSYSLNSEAREGTYKISVSEPNIKRYHHFKVEKYVLPKFDVTLNMKDKISIQQEEIEAKVCAKYTYGQPVPGFLAIMMCRPLSHYATRTYANADSDQKAEITAPCHAEIKETEKNGCATFKMMMADFTKLDMKAVQDRLDVRVQMEEQGTGVSNAQEKKVTLTYVIGKLSFIDTPKIYEKGTNVTGKVKAVDYNDKPLPDMPLYLFEGERWASRRLQNLTTNTEGIAEFSVSTDHFNGDVRLQLSDLLTLQSRGYRGPHYESGYHALSMSQPSTVDTKTVSFLKVQKREEKLPCDEEVEVVIDYVVVKEAQGSVDIMYLVLARGAIATQGLEHVDVQENIVNEGKVSFKLTVSPDMAPEVQVVAYVVLPSETVIAHSANFSTEKCFGHKVMLEFSPTSAVPGEKASMQMTAQPNSLCGVSAVDQSVLIKEPGKTLTEENIFSLIPVTKASRIPYQAQDPTECMHVRPRRYIMPLPESQDDAYSVFQSVGLKMATNMFVRVPSCLKYRGREYHYVTAVAGYGGGYGPTHSYLREYSRNAGPVRAAIHNRVPDPVIETVRTFFPETWIWDLLEIGDSGRRDVPLTVPDTITTWETEAFCLSPQGFGLAPRQKLTVFQPFFLELTMPYSIIRGEEFQLKATVFNYLTSCLMITVTPAASTNYTLTALSGDQYTSCLCGNQRKTLRWTMTPSALGVVNVTMSAEAVASHLSCNNEIVDVPERGRVDVVTKSLIVKAEGTEVTQTENWLLCPNGGVLTGEKQVSLPADVVEGSERAAVSVLGDILGRALKNLDGMLRMPYGCGEQNMALLAPNIYILEYLKNTNQLTPAIMEKATNFLSSGYQRQLNYKHGDGAFSTFGSGSGNTWLTAFVLRTFAKAESFVYVDPTVIEKSKNWLINKQREGGCFEMSGKLFNNRMKGGVSDEVTLTAYITAAFLETNRSVDNPVVKESLACLKESMRDLSNTYTTALMAYVFTLAGDMETRDRLLQYLDTVAIREGGFLHWSQSSRETSASLSVEISSYVMMAKLNNHPAAEDLGYTSGIVRWLTGQQNYYGGFSSTQDTVVALQALALYSSLVFSPGGSSTVTVQSPSGQLLFEVNPDNKLLYQETLVQDAVGKYSLEVKGEACASVQLSRHYNIPPPPPTATLSVKVQTEVDVSKPERAKLTLKLQSLYIGKENNTNMVILDIKVLSGFVPDQQSLKKLRGALLVDRVDHKEDHVLVYLQKLPKDIPINHILDLIQEVPVQNLKPAVVKIYDYYQPSDHAETEYIFPKAADDNLS